MQTVVKRKKRPRSHLQSQPSTDFCHTNWSQNDEEMLYGTVVFRAAGNVDEQIGDKSKNLSNFVQNHKKKLDAHLLRWPAQSIRLVSRVTKSGCERRAPSYFRWFEEGQRLKNTGCSRCCIYIGYYVLKIKRCQGFNCKEVYDGKTEMDGRWDP